MRGSLLVSYYDFDGFGGDYVDIYSNNVLLKRIYNFSTNLYCIPIYLNDVVRIETVTNPNVVTELTLSRRDYTTDDIGGNNGISEVLIVSNLPFTTYTFTATTVNTAYDFEYRFINDVITQFQIWTEASQPIMTENNDYINKQF